KIISQTQSKLRRLEKTLGTVRLEWNCDPNLWIERLIQWKCQQIDHKLFDDIFIHRHVRRLIESVGAMKSDGCQRVLTLLWVGDNVAAMHLGLAHGNCLSTWFPTHPPEFARFSPGQILMYLLLSKCEQHGVTRVELGRGMNQLKSRFMTDSHFVSIGAVDASRTRRFARQGKQMLRTFVLESPFGNQCTGLYRHYKRWARRWA
ncbi:MAG: GNAT family N-acetyltransferase, partial [Planctomycetota bacterium]